MPDKTRRVCVTRGNLINNVLIIYRRKLFLLKEQDEQDEDVHQVHPGPLMESYYHAIVRNPKVRFMFMCALPIAELYTSIQT